MNIREKARDTQRKSDLKQIQKALELYKLNQATAVYPTGSGTPSTIGTAGSSWIENGVTYMNKIPGDPSGLTPTPYYYSRTSSLTYTLCACIENIADSDPNVSSGNCSANYTCLNSKKYELSQP